jgi:hypothetical protein
MAASEPPLRELLDGYVPRYAAGRVADSASDLEQAEASCGSSSCDAASSADAATLRELARAARRLGRSRLGLGDYAVIKLGQKGGFGRVAQSRVSGCSALFAVKTVRGHTLRDPPGVARALVGRCTEPAAQRSMMFRGDFSRAAVAHAPTSAQVELNRQGDPHSCTPPSPALDVRRLKRAVAELTSLAALPSSPLLPSLFDAFTSRDGRRAHIVTNFVPGTDLAARLSASDGCASVEIPLSPSRRLSQVSSHAPACPFADVAPVHAGACRCRTRASLPLKCCLRWSLCTPQGSCTAT